MEPAPESSFVEEVMSLKKSVGLEEDESDTEEHSEELTTKEPSSGTKKMLKSWKRVWGYFAKYLADKTAAIRSTNLFI